MLEVVDAEWLAKQKNFSLEKLIVTY